jgi:hypothetical protein
MISKSPPLTPRIVVSTVLDAVFYMLPGIVGVSSVMFWVYTR